MPGTLAYSFSPAELIALAVGGVLVLVLAALGWRAWKRSRITPEERERRRRAHIVAIGKMGDAMVVEVRENFLFYSYDVRGVQYTASQDMTTLQHLLPTDLSVSVGSVMVKYDSRNPANSVVLSEEWSGFRVTAPEKCTEESKAK